MVEANFFCTDFLVNGACRENEALTSDLDGGFGAGFFFAVGRLLVGCFVGFLRAATFCADLALGFAPFLPPFDIGFLCFTNFRAVFFLAMTLLRFGAWGAAKGIESHYPCKPSRHCMVGQVRRRLRYDQVEDDDSGPCTLS
ncbi:MAG: hypothetical protein IPL52_15960 [Flavobacteriales bacterium]|nr:hypothetical protein [Flavobacteriales bacterium]